MLKRELERKLEIFLKENNRPFYENSIKYSDLRKMRRRDGSSRMLHVVNFMVSISNQQHDGDAFYFATFDEKKHNLIEIVGPQHYEKIGD